MGTGVGAQVKTRQRRARAVDQRAREMAWLCGKCENSPPVVWITVRLREQAGGAALLKRSADVGKRRVVQAVGDIWHCCQQRCGIELHAPRFGY